MKPSVPRGNKKKAVQPVIITTDTKFTPKISQRTIEKRKAARERLLKGSRFASGLDICGVICLYIFLILSVIIGGGGIALCIVYISTDSSTQGWKIAGIIMGAVTCIIGVILILLTIFKQTRNRPWRYKKEKKPNTNDYYGEINDDDDDDDDNQTKIENIDDNQIQNNTILPHSNTILSQGSKEERRNVSQSAIIHLSNDGKTRETASSPIPDPSIEPLNLKTINNDIIFCPGCNRTHPSAHQCMYSTRLANGFATQLRPTLQVSQQDSIATQTEEDGKMKKKTGPHTVIDRSLKYSNTNETQTDVSANPRSNITESIILRRVPIPTAKVIVQQPTTKVMIVKVPNVAGQLVIQPKSESSDEQYK